MVSDGKGDRAPGSNATETWGGAGRAMKRFRDDLSGARHTFETCATMGRKSPTWSAYRSLISSGGLTRLKIAPS